MMVCALFQRVEQARRVDSLVSEALVIQCRSKIKAVAYCQMSVQVIFPVELCVHFSSHKTIMINGNQACFAGQGTSVYDVVGAMQ